jgi:glycosyltransferase involved in cell wall biosynthesis
MASRRVASNENRVIPRIIHQTWRDAIIPEAFAAYAQTWRNHHPEWEYRLWTDADNRDLVARHYPWFLPAYDAYPEPIMRADAARYFILHRFGGVYADLDFECLRPLDTLIAEHDVVFGVEPEAHSALQLSRERGFDFIVCNALMASIPAHPFFEHLFRMLSVYERAPGPLDAAGPFLLTRAYLSYAQRDGVHLLPAEMVYPVTAKDSEAGLLTNSVERARIETSAFAIHHWAGTWWRKESQSEATSEGKLPVRLVDRGRLLATAEVEPERARAGIQADGPAPLVSALMVTRARSALAALAIRCFLAQTYAHTELVIIDDDENDSLALHVQALQESRIRHLRLPSEGRTLGDLRNLAVESASGEYVCQWDDDDLSDPQRIELQVAVLRALGAQACFLQREQIICVKRRIFARSGRRLWEGSFLCERARMPRYPLIRRGEDTPVTVSILRENRIVILDRPDLYTYVFHGENTFSGKHFDDLLHAATEIFEGIAFEPAVRGLGTRLGLKPVELGLQESSGAEGLGSPVAKELVRQSSGNAVTPFVLILCPVKDAARFLPAFIENLRGLTFDHQKLSVVFLEGDSRDGTAGVIERQLAELARDFRRAELYRRDFGFRSDLPRWEPSIQRERRSTLARSRNYLLSCGLRDEEWVLWMDVDVAAYPPDLIEQLLASGKDIVVPHCVVAAGGPTFDLNTFVLTPGTAERDVTRFVVDGILQPPRGEGRIYLESLRDCDLVEVDAVGGTTLLIRADLHREGLIFPSAPYQLHIETEGLAFLARDMGYRCFALPRLEVIHPPAG